MTSLWGGDTSINVNTEGTLIEQSFIATIGQTLFNLTKFTYTPGTNSLFVYVNGLFRVVTRDFIETSGASFTLIIPAIAGDKVDVVGIPKLNINSTDATEVTYLPPYTGGTQQTVYSVLSKTALTPFTFGAIGDGAHDDSAAFALLFSFGIPWFIPYTPNGYLVSQGFVIKASGECKGRLIYASGFSGKAITYCNVPYANEIVIEKLNLFSTDIRPDPYTAAASYGHYVGPTPDLVGNTSTPGVRLVGCIATRFSYNCLISTFNVVVDSCDFELGDHNLTIYTTDTLHNQINNIKILNSSCDSPASSYGQPYSLRVGTFGPNTYSASIGMGYGIEIHGCNFDSGPVYLDNIIQSSFTENYCEQQTGYTYHGGAIVVGSAGTNTLQNCNIEKNIFNQFDYAVVEKNPVLGLSVLKNSCAAVKYRELYAVGCEQEGFIYEQGTSIGSFNGNGDPIATNFSLGVSDSQIDFSGISNDRDWLNNGVQTAFSSATINSWYPYGTSIDGWQNVGSTSGRFRTGSAMKSGITGNQTGQLFQFNNIVEAVGFQGGDKLDGLGAGAATYILSVDYVAGTAELNKSFTGATTLTHASLQLIGNNLFGSGSPEGVVTAPPGSKYTNLNGGDHMTIFVKESGTGNTGWIGK